jgi:hypothetical protein
MREATSRAGLHKRVDQSTVRWIFLGRKLRFRHRLDLTPPQRRTHDAARSRLHNDKARMP